jgi:DNA-binding response OmpR family regulator
MEILIVHANSRTTKVVVRALSARGHQSVVVSSMGEGETQLSGARWDLVLLSQEFEGGDAVTFLKRARRAGRVLPIAVVDTEIPNSEQVALLGAGLDLVLESAPTPKDAESLVVRLEALVRRSWQLAAPRRIDFGGLIVDEGRRVLETPEGDAPLAPGELKLLVLLAERTGTTVTRAELRAAVAGELVDLSDNALESIIKRLRKKSPELMSRLSNVRTQGYILLPPAI